MRFLSGFLPTLAAITVGTTALKASVIVFGPETQGHGTASSAVSISTLQQLLELRSKSFTTTTLKDSDEKGIEVLETLAGPPRRLFGKSSAQWGFDTIMVVLEGLNGDVDTSYLDGHGSDSIVSTFATATARDAFIDYLLEVRPEGIVSPESRHCLFSSNEHSELDNQKDPAKSCLPLDSDIHDLSRVVDGELLSQISVGEAWIDSLRGTIILHVVFKTESRSISENNMRSLFSVLHSLALDGKKTTAVILSAPGPAQKSYPYRTPDVKGVDLIKPDSINKRSIPLRPHSQLPLSLAPVCYASNSSCTDATGACSGRGACYKKSSDCYACRCFETYVKTGKGAERKVQWGGSACQKQDVSSPFFLIAGVSVATVVAISAAIGMIFHVGNAELPGVISAGVGAARAQK